MKERIDEVVMEIMGAVASDRGNSEEVIRGILEKFVRSL